MAGSTGTKGTDMDSDRITIKQKRAAYLLDIDPSDVSRMLSDGRLPLAMVGKRRMVDYKKLMQMIDADGSVLNDTDALGVLEQEEKACHTNVKTQSTGGLHSLTLGRDRELDALLERPAKRKQKH